MKEPVQLHQSEIQLQQRCADLERDNERLREAIEDVLPLLCNESDGGCLTGMADQKRRLQWYGKLGPVRNNLRAALEQK